MGKTWPHDDLLHAWWVEPGRLLAGEYPGALAPEKAARKLQLLFDAGIGSIVDLTTVDLGRDIAQLIAVEPDAAAGGGLGDELDLALQQPRNLAADRLRPEELELLSTAAWWAGRPDEASDALERAFSGYADAGRSSDAARVAMLLAYQAFRRRNESIGGGWLARAARLLESEPESALHARFLVFQSLGALMETRIAEGIELADQAMEMARKHDDRSALYMAMSFKGMAEVFAGNWQAGLALIDEAATAASSNQLDLRVASDIWCNTIAACRNAGDYKRAAQWVEEGERWMHRQSVGGYPGICRVHRAELKMLRGRWSEAEQEARQACDELEQFGLLDAVGYAHYQVGEVRLRMGDLEAAAEAFDRAFEYGHDAQPGLSLLQLARGEVDEAAKSIGRALAVAAGSGGPADRATRHPARGTRAR